MCRLYSAVSLIVVSLFRRFRTVLGEAMKFGVVGAANVVINFLVFLALAVTICTGSELKANVVATVVATTTSYVMNRYWTFRDRPKSTPRREYPLFFLFNAAGLAIELAVMGLAKYGLGLTSLTALTIAKGAGIGLGTIFRFWTYRSFVFAARPAPTLGTQSPVPVEELETESLKIKAPVGSAPARVS